MTVVLLLTLVSDEYAPQRARRVVTRTYSTFGDRAFATASARLWNNLPPHFRDADLLYSRFRWSLDIFVCIVGPRRSANYFNCAV